LKQRNYSNKTESNMTRSPATRAARQGERDGRSLRWRARDGC
jgi:hypothetical protein